MFSERTVPIAIFFYHSIPGCLNKVFRKKGRGLMVTHTQGHLTALSSTGRWWRPLCLGHKGVWSRGTALRALIPKTCVASVKYLWPSIPRVTAPHFVMVLDWRVRNEPKGLDLDTEVPNVFLNMGVWYSNQQKDFGTFPLPLVWQKPQWH